MSNTRSSDKADSPSNQANTPKGDNKKQEGPDRLSPQLDDEKQWSEVASEPGYQKGDQGGYKGSVADTKYQHINDQELKRRAPAAPGKGDDDGRKTPLQQNDRSANKRESN